MESDDESSHSSQNEYTNLIADIHQPTDCPTVDNSMVINDEQTALVADTSPTSQLPDILLHHIKTNQRLSNVLTTMVLDQDLDHFSVKDRNIMLALKLIKLQHSILGEAIDTMYTTTKRNITDITQSVKTYSEKYQMMHDADNLVEPFPPASQSSATQREKSKISFSSTSSFHYYDESIGHRSQQDIDDDMALVKYSATSQATIHPPLSSSPPPSNHTAPPPPPPPPSPTNMGGFASVGEIFKGCSFTNVGSVTVNITRK